MLPMERVCPHCGGELHVLGRETRRGIMLSRQTMPNRLIRAAEDWLEPVYERMKALLPAREVLHADETTLQVLWEPGKTAQSKSYMWLYRTSGDAAHPIVLYLFEKDRANSSALVGKRYCDRLFELERSFADLAPDERHTKRQESSKPLMEAFFIWAEACRVLPKTLTDKAVHYALS